MSELGFEVNDGQLLLPFEQVALPEVERNHRELLRQRLGAVSLWGREHLARPLIAAAVVAAPPLAALAAVEYAPPAHVDNLLVGDMPTSVKLEIGQDATKFQIKNALGAIIPHAITIPGINKKVGITVESSIDNLDLVTKDGINTQQVTALRQVISGGDERLALDKAADQTKLHYEKWGFGAVYLVLLAESGMFVGHKQYQRKLAARTPAEREAIKDQTRVRSNINQGVVAVTAGALLVNGVYSISPLSDRHETITADPVLANVAALKGSELTGPLAGLVDKVGPSVSNVLTSRNKFFKTVTVHQKAAFEAKYGVAKLPKRAGVLRVVFVDDIQGVAGEEEIAGQDAQLYNADLIVVGGDTSFSGQSWETFSIDPLAHYAGRVPIFANLGLHDNSPTNAIKKLMQQAHMTVADDKLHTLAGATILGVNDPNELPPLGMGGTVHPVDKNIPDAETAIAQTTTNAVTQACEQHPLIFTVHDRAIGDVVARTGCASIVLTGREYAPQPPQTYSFTDGDGVTHTTQEIISGSTGGHGAGDGPELTIIHQDASFQELDIDQKTKTILSMDMQTTHADGTYTITQSLFSSAPDLKHVEAASKPR